MGTRLRFGVLFTLACAFVVPARSEIDIKLKINFDNTKKMEPAEKGALAVAGLAVAMFATIYYRQRQLDRARLNASENLARDLEREAQALKKIADKGRKILQKIGITVVEDPAQLRFEGKVIDMSGDVTAQINAELAGIEGERLGRYGHFTQLQNQLGVELATARAEQVRLAQVGAEKANKLLSDALSSARPANAGAKRAFGVIAADLSASLRAQTKLRAELDALPAEKNEREEMYEEYAEMLLEPKTQKKALEFFFASTYDEALARLRILHESSKQEYAKRDGELRSRIANWQSKINSLAKRFDEVSAGGFAARGSDETVLAAAKLSGEKLEALLTLRTKMREKSQTTEVPFPGSDVAQVTELARRIVGQASGGSLSFAALREDAVLGQAVASAQQKIRGANDERALALARNPRSFATLRQLAEYLDANQKTDFVAMYRDVATEKEKFEFAKAVLDFLSQADESAEKRVASHYRLTKFLSEETQSIESPSHAGRFATTPELAAAFTELNANYLQPAIKLSEGPGEFINRRGAGRMNSFMMSAPAGVLSADSPVDRPFENIDPATALRMQEETTAIIQRAHEQGNDALARLRSETATMRERRYGLARAKSAHACRDLLSGPAPSAMAAQ